MDFRCQSSIPFSRDTVYRAYFDRLEEIGEASPDLESIRVQYSETRLDGTLVSSVWRVRDRFGGVLSAEMLTWDVQALWRPFLNQWTLSPRGLEDRVSCWGSQHFYIEGRHCRVVLEGDLNLRMPFASVVERVAIELVPRNLERVNQALTEVIQRVRGGLSGDPAAQ